MNALESERNELKQINGELERQKRDSHASFEKTSVKVDTEKPFELYELESLMVFLCRWTLHCLAW